MGGETITRFFSPKSVAEALAIFDRERSAQYAGGGLSFVCGDDPWNLTTPPAVITLGGISELSRLSAGNRYLEVGACVRLSSLFSIERYFFPTLLSEILNRVEPSYICNHATAGGVLCATDALSDFIPALSILNAQIECRHRRPGKRNTIRSRWNPIEDITMSPGELLTRVRIPIQDWSHSFYWHNGKKTRNRVHNISFFCLMNRDEEIIDSIRLAILHGSNNLWRDKEWEEKMIGWRGNTQDRRAIINSLRRQWNSFFEEPLVGRIAATLLERFLTGNINLMDHREPLGHDKTNLL